MTSTWKEFWNGEHAIYVSPRHTEVYYRKLGQDVLEILPRGRPLTFLDWGCGDALAAPELALHGLQVLLYDPVPRVRERIAARFAKTPNITVLSGDESALAQGSIDVILVHSVLQYISKEEFKKILERFNRILAPGGMLLLGDIVPRHLSMFSDITDLLSAALRNGFLFDALLGMGKTFFSEYRFIRRANGFTTYSEEEIIEILQTRGFSAESMKHNLGLSSHRMLIRGIKTK